MLKQGSLRKKVSLGLCLGTMLYSGVGYAAVTTSTVTVPDTTVEGIAITATGNVTAIELTGDGYVEISGAGSVTAPNIKVVVTGADGSSGGIYNEEYNVIMKGQPIFLSVDVSGSGTTDVRSKFEAYGVYNDDTSITFSGDVNIIATGNGSEIYSTVYGVYDSGNTTFNGNTNINAIATTTGTHYTTAYGVENYKGETVFNGDTTISATAVDAGGDTYVEVYSLENSGHIVFANKATVNATVVGVEDCYAVSVNNTNGGSIDFRGDALINTTVTGDKNISAYGLDAYSSGGVVQFGGDANINVTATVNEDSRVTGISVSNNEIKFYGDTTVNVKTTGQSGQKAYGVKTYNATMTFAGVTAINALAKGDDSPYAFGIHSSGGISTFNKEVTVNATAIAVDHAIVYGVFPGNNNQTIFNEATTINATAIASGDGSEAYGMYADYSDINFNGDTIIKATAITETGDNIRAKVLYANGTSTININQSVEGVQPTNVVKLEGDIQAANGGSINITLNTADSYLQGNVLDTGTNLTLADGATWRPVYDNRNGTWGDTLNITWESDGSFVSATNSISTLNLSGDGIVDLTWDDSMRTTYRTMEMGALSGTGGVYKINTNLGSNTGDVIAITTDNQEATAVNTIKVVYDPSVGASGSSTVVTGATSGATYVGGTSESRAYGITPVVEKVAGTDNWEISSLVTVASENTKTAADAALSMGDLWLVEGNSLSKRMGELRGAKATEGGVWARYRAGNIEENGRKTELDYKQIQAGYDVDKTVDDGKVYRGIMLSRITGNTVYERGAGDVKETTFGLYQTWVGDSGHYYDLTAKVGRLSNDYHVTDLSDNYSHGDYAAWAYTLSGEYGYRKNCGNGVYVEPQAEIIMGHINGSNYTMSNGMEVKEDGMNRFVTRLGVEVGKKMARGSIYGKVSYLHDLGGGAGIQADGLSYNRSYARNWGELVLGGSAKLGAKTDAYLELEKEFGPLSSNIQYNIGLRYAF